MSERSPQSNPFAAPLADCARPADLEHQQRVSDSSIRILERTRPWVLLVGMLGLLFSFAMMLVTGFGILALLGTRSGIVAMITLLYGLFAGLSCYASLRLIQYSSHIRRLSEVPTVKVLDAALESQRSAWNVLGAATGFAMVITAVLLAYNLFIAVLAEFPVG